MGHDIKRQKNVRSMKSLASPAFFFHQMKRTLYICLIFLFLVAPEKGPTENSLSLPFTLLASLLLSLSFSLCSSPWLALTHWSASGWKNRGTLLWVCQRRWKEEERRNEERDRREKEEEEERRKRGLVRKRKKNLSIQMLKRKVDKLWRIILPIYLNPILIIL